VRSRSVIGISDTAEMYANEEAIGAAIAASKVARKDLPRHHQGLERKPGAGCDPQGIRHQPEKVGASTTSISILVHWPSKT